MNIGIDARVIHFPGIGRYIRNLVQGLAAMPTDDRFTIYLSPRPLRDGEGTGTGARQRDRARQEQPGADSPHDGVSLPTDLGSRFTIRTLPDTFSVKEQWLVPRAAAADRLDLFHTPHYVVPLFLHCPCVATFHDLTYYKHPASLRSLPAQAYYRLMHRVGHRRAARILCPSDATRRDLRRLLGVPEAKLQTVYPGIDPRFRPPGRARVEALRERLGLGEFVLYVGTKKRFKNVPTLLRAFGELGREHPSLRLVLAGRGKIEDPEIPPLLDAPGLSGRVTLLEPLPEEEMPALYAAARALVLPSFNEGFGSPLAEAMACGAPCVVANAGALPEVAGDAALLFSPRDPQELARLLRRLLADRDLANRLAERGLRRARSFDSASTAASTYAVYREAVARHRQSE